MRESELVLSEILGCSRVALYLERERRLDKRISLILADILKRRIKGEPLPYILGKVEFMGMEFKVNPYVFIPRPETEVLVEEVINILRRNNYRKPRILDIGTGSGCIAIYLSKIFPDAEIIATDISSDALEIAKENAHLHKVNIRFLRSDIFKELARDQKFDIIVSNPPYIPTNQINKLHLELQYEPRIALDGGRDGLYFYRRIIREAKFCLKEEGYLILEIGMGQLLTIKRIIEDLKYCYLENVIRDYNYLERIITIRRKDG